jgi:GNAT superfamily N-acetyltransferase
MQGVVWESIPLPVLGNRLCRILFPTVKLDYLHAMNSLPHNPPSIRSATTADARLLALLARELLEYERSLNEQAVELNPWAASVDEMRKQILRPNTCFFVAEGSCPEEGRTIVGYVKAVIYGLPPERSEVGLRRWLLAAAERSAQRAFNFVMRRPRPNVQATGGYIAGIFVRPDVRRAGVGQALMAAAEEWFRAHGVVTSELHVLYANDLARHFWAEAGYEPLAMGMRKKL